LGFVNFSDHILKGYKYNNKIRNANFPCLQPMVELQRNQRDEIEHKHVHVKAQYAATQSMFDLTSSTLANDGISQIDHVTGAYIPTLFIFMHTVSHRLPADVQG